MCLTSIKSNYKNAQFGVGYKMFEVVDGKLCSPSCLAQLTTFPVNKWLKDTQSYKLETESFRVYYQKELRQDHEYETGFHIYVNKVDAKLSVKQYHYSNPHRNLVVYMVFYRKVVSVGMNKTLEPETGLTIVAKEINVQEKV